MEVVIKRVPTMKWTWTEHVSRQHVTRWTRRMHKRSVRRSPRRYMDMRQAACPLVSNSQRQRKRERRGEAHIQKWMLKGR